MNFKSKTTGCLVAGVLVLAVSATAAFGSVSGYSNYKNGIKKLALDTDNAYITGSYSITLDGAEVDRTQMEYAFDRGNYALHSIESYGGNKETERWDTLLDGENIWFRDVDESYYRQTRPEPGSSSLLGIEFGTGGDEYTKRLMDFAEVFTDTVVGDLKNNFILTSSENGCSTYTIDISRNQVPTIISSGLSLIAYSIGESNMEGTVNYEEYSASALHYYEEQTGETLPEDFVNGFQGSMEEAAYDEWEDRYGDLQDKVWEMSNEMDSYYYDLLAKEHQNAGVLYVDKNNTATWYSDSMEFSKQTGDEIDISNVIGEDLAIDHVNCTATVDENGNLTANTIKAVFGTVDINGVQHEMSLTMDLKISDFGNTVVTMPDVGERTLYDCDA